MNYHAKSGVSSLKIDQVMFNLIFGGHFFDNFLRRVNMNFHAKSGASSLKIE